GENKPHPPGGAVCQTNKFEKIFPFNINHPPGGAVCQTKGTSGIVRSARAMSESNSIPIPNGIKIMGGIRPRNALRGGRFDKATPQL
ncbi:MAG: hypothetical protein ACP5IB_09700, partial [Thermoplasmata archaeon]